MGEVAASDEMLERCIYGQLHPSCSACHCCLLHVCLYWLTTACQPSLICQLLNLRCIVVTAVHVSAG